MSSDEDEKKKLYEFDGSYLKELNKIRRQFNLVEINETKNKEKISKEFESDSEKNVSLEHTGVKKKITKLKKTNNDEEEEEIRNVSLESTTKKKFKTKTSKKDVKFDEKQHKKFKAKKSKDAGLQIDLSFMQIDDAELYRCDNSDMTKLNQIRKELNLPEIYPDSNFLLSTSRKSTSKIKENSKTDIVSQKQFLPKTKKFDSSVAKTDVSVKEKLEHQNVQQDLNITRIRHSDSLENNPGCSNLEEVESNVKKMYKKLQSELKEKSKKETQTFFVSETRVNNTENLENIFTFKNPLKNLIFQKINLKEDIYLNVGKTKSLLKTENNLKQNFDVIDNSNCSKLEKNTKEEQETKTKNNGTNNKNVDNQKKSSTSFRNFVKRLRVYPEEQFDEESKELSSNLLQVTISNKPKVFENVEMNQIQIKSEESVSAVLKPIQQVSPVLEKNNLKIKNMLEKDLARNEEIYFHPSKTKFVKDTDVIFNNSKMYNENNFNENQKEEFLPNLTNVKGSFEKFITKTIFKHSDLNVQQSFCSLNVPSVESEMILKKSLDDVKSHESDVTGRKLFVSSDGKDSLVFHVSKTERMVGLDLPRRYLETFNFPSIAYIDEWMNLPYLGSKNEQKYTRKLDINETRRKINEKLEEISQLEELYFFTEKQKLEFDKSTKFNKNKILPNSQTNTDLDDSGSTEMFSIITEDSDFDAKVEKKKKRCRCLCSCFNNN